MAFGRGGAPYTHHRIPLYILLWITAAALLGLTAFRVHHTRKTLGFYDPIIVELLVTSVLTLLWIPYAIFKVIAQRATTGGTTGNNTTGRGARHPGLRNEMGGNTFLWLMWLVGAAVTTHKWPSRFFCGPGFQCKILTVILALAWIGWSLLTIIKVLSLMQHAAAYDGGYYHGGTSGYGTNSGTGVNANNGMSTNNNETGTTGRTGMFHHGDKHNAGTGVATGPGTGGGYA